MYFYVAAAVLYFVLTMITFLESSRNSWYFIPLATVLNVGSSLLWIFYARSLPDKESILYCSAWWDLMVVIVCNVVPLLVFRMGFNAMQYVGFAVIFVGFVLLELFKD